MRKSSDDQFAFVTQLWRKIQFQTIRDQIWHIANKKHMNFPEFFCVVWNFFLFIFFLYAIYDANFFINTQRFPPADKLATTTTTNMWKTLPKKKIQQQKTAFYNHQTNTNFNCPEHGLIFFLISQIENKKKIVQKFSRFKVFFSFFQVLLVGWFFFWKCTFFLFQMQFSMQFLIANFQFSFFHFFFVRFFLFKLIFFFDYLLR